jgi:hypothetical protein
VNSGPFASVWQDRNLAALIAHLELARAMHTEPRGAHM